MAEVRVRKLDDDVKLMLRDQAVRHGQNLESYLRGVLKDTAVRPRRELAQRLASLREDIRREHGTLSDSAVLIRQDRDERG